MTSKKWPRKIKIGNKIIERTEDDYKKWATQAGSRILSLSKMKPFKWKINGKEAGVADFRDIIIPNPDGHGTTINIGKPGLKQRDNLVGFAGVYTDPYWFGAGNADDAIKSWNWFFSQARISSEQIGILEGFCIMSHITTGYNLPQVFRIMSLATDLKSLSEDGLNVKQKINEISSYMKGNFRASNKKAEDKTGGLIRINNLINYISDIFAETRLARFAHSFGLQVKLTRHPDIIIDNVNVEVKFDRTEFNLRENSLQSDIKKGLEQGGDLVAIYTGDFRRKMIFNYKITWLPRENLNIALETGIELTKKSRKCVLLFTGTIDGYFGKLGLIR